MPQTQFVLKRVRPKKLSHQLDECEAGKPRIQALELAAFKAC